MNRQELMTWLNGAGAAIATWVDIPVFKICFRHTSGSVGAMLCFKGAAVAADYLVAREWLWYVHTIENITLIGLLLWLVFQLGVLLWTHRVNHNAGLHLLVFA